jgi:RHS repeat-associated protein
MAADDHHQYAYDGENRITTVDITGAKYGYDANGNRVRKDVESNYTEYIYFGSNIIAEHDQAGGWSDYIFANGKRIAKAGDYEHQIQVSGQVCSACGTQTYSLAFSNLGSLTGHVIQSGDILHWQQWQSTGSIGGITVTMTDGTKSVTTGSAANQWQSFAVDLSTLHGKTISSIALYEDPSTQPGTWTLYYQDIVFTAANGTVQPLFSQNPTVPALSGSGTSGVTNVTTAIHICLDPGCAPANTTTYYHGDQIGSSRMLSNGHGYPVWQGTFLPFGEEYNPQITDNHYKFTGKERDSETGLDYFGARYCGSKMGRFTSPDKPFADQHVYDPQSWNLYSYTRNNPLKYIDTDGRKVQVADQGALKNIRQGLPANVRSHVVTDKNGFISGKALNGIKSNDANFQALKHIVGAKATVEVSTGASATNAVGKTLEFKYESDSAVRKDLQSKGITPTAGKDYTTNGTGITYSANESKSGNIEVHVSDGTGQAATAPSIELVVTTGHELYVHAANLLDDKPAEHEDTPDGPVNQQTKEVEGRTRKNAQEQK